MADITKAEAQRRAHEWLRIEFDVPEQTDVFEAAKRDLSPTNTGDVAALIAIGEFRWVRALIPTVNDARVFLESVAAYFAASADDGFARDVGPRVVADVEALGNEMDAETLRQLAFAAEALGNRTWAASINERARTALEKRSVGGSEIVTVVYRTLGYAPDASKGRLLLRPVIDPAWKRLRIQNIHIGDALVDLEYVRSDTSMRFEVNQVAGAYPVRLIFEPVLARSIGKAFVDETPAALDFRPAGERFIVPVQIMLDDRRVVRFE